MSWPDRMRVDPSRMEVEIIKALQKKKVGQRFQRDYAIVFPSETSCQIVWKQNLTLDMTKTAKCYCFPDFLCLLEDVTIYFGIDGPRHLTPHNSERDNRQDRFMKACRIKYVRFSYNRYTKGKMKKIVEAMIMYMENPELEMNETVYC